MSRLIGPSGRAMVMASGKVQVGTAGDPCCCGERSCYKRWHSTYDCDTGWGDPVDDGVYLCLPFGPDTDALTEWHYVEQDAVCKAEILQPDTTFAPCTDTSTCSDGVYGDVNPETGLFEEGFPPPKPTLPGCVVCAACCPAIDYTIDTGGTNLAGDGVTPVPCVVSGTMLSGIPFGFCQWSETASNPGDGAFIYSVSITKVNCRWTLTFCRGDICAFDSGDGNGCCYTYQAAKSTRFDDCPPLDQSAYTLVSTAGTNPIDPLGTECAAGITFTLTCNDNPLPG